MKQICVIIACEARSTWALIRIWVIWWAILEKFKLDNSKVTVCINGVSITLKMFYFSLASIHCREYRFLSSFLPFNPFSISPFLSFFLLYILPPLSLFLWVFPLHSHKTQSNYTPQIKTVTVVVIKTKTPTIRTKRTPIHKQ